jgi:hypothetical protein
LASVQFGEEVWIAGEEQWSAFCKGTLSTTAPVFDRGRSYGILWECT